MLCHEDQSLPDHMPHTITLRKLFSRYLDINTVPRRSFFAMLRYFLTDDMEREKVDEFLSPEGAVSLVSRFGRGVDSRCLRMISTNTRSSCIALFAKFLKSSAVRKFLGITFLTCFHP